MTPLWPIIRPHLFWIILGSVVLLLGRSWLSEHDNRLLISGKVDGLQETIKAQNVLIDQLHAQKAKEVQVVHTIVKEAKTHDQQLAAIPQLASVPLNAQSLPDAPSAVKVDIEPLVSQLGRCKEDAISLGACQKEIEYRNQIEMEQGQQVTLLKKKPTFWATLGNKAEKVAPCAVSGAVLGASAKGNRGQNAAFGVALGGVLCGLVFK